MNTRRGFVRTVLGDIEPSGLGPAYVHEHLILDSPLIAAEYPHIHLPSVDEAVAELGACVAAGLGAVVDAMPAAGGRDAAKLAEISRRSGVHVIATTGLHTSRYYGDHEWTRTESPDELATRFIAEIESGIDAHDYRGDLVERTEHRAGMLKVATIGEEPSEAEARLFEAAANAHTATGVPILTHCEAGRGAIQQIEMFAALGVDLSRVALSHTDKVADRSYHRDLLDTGVNIAYDQALRQVDQDTVATAGLIADMITAGHEHQILLGTDGARRSLWRTLGGSPGLAWILTGLPKELSSRGIESRAIARLLVDNPARYLAFA